MSADEFESEETRAKGTFHLKADLDIREFQLEMAANADH
jgi:hypothetical protein